MSGDVFEAHIKSLDEPHELVMVVSHPCSMRAGAHLRPLIQVAPVTVKQPSSLSAGQWRGSYKLMLLPDLRRDGKTYVATFELSSPFKTSDLDLARRTAILSEYGILIFYQRHVRHLTRLDLGIRDLEPVTRAVFTELALQDDWNQSLARARVEAGEDLTTVLAEEESAFDAFMKTPGTSGAALREELEHTYLHASVRRIVRLEIQRRQN
jgi:hypothetical protein